MEACLNEDEARIGQQSPTCPTLPFSLTELEEFISIVPGIRSRMQRPTERPEPSVS